MRQDLTVAYVSDGGLFMPTLRSAHSALAQSSQPLRLKFVGVGLEDWMRRSIERLQRHHKTSDVELIELPQEWLRDATSPKSFITTTALGRMFLPRLVDGRVLYIDGDTIVMGDLSQAGQIDLAGNPIAGVRDFAVMNWRATGKSEPLKRQADLLGRTELTSYINSGVLLMDCDAIRAEQGLQAQMEDLVAARGYPTVDQDRINAIFGDRITHLDPAWNCSWGRLSLQRRHDASLPVIAATNRPVVLHFHGPHKPWHRLRLSSVRKGATAVWRYRRAMSEFERLFPDLPR